MYHKNWNLSDIFKFENLYKMGILFPGVDVCGWQRDSTEQATATTLLEYSWLLWNTGYSTYSITELPQYDYAQLRWSVYIMYPPAPGIVICDYLIRIYYVDMLTQGRCFQH